MDCALPDIFNPSIVSACRSSASARMPNVARKAISRAVNMPDAEFLAVLYKSVIQVAGIVIDGSATGITAYDFDMLLLNIVSVYLVPYVLVLTDDDGRFVLPQHEDVVRKVLEQILLGCQVEPGIRVWIVDIKHYQR